MRLRMGDIRVGLQVKAVLALTLVVLAATTVGGCAYYRLIRHWLSAGAPAVSAPVQAHLARAQQVLVVTAAAIVAGSLPISWVLVWRVLVQPVRRLVGATERLAAGDFTARAAPARNDEIGHLAERFNAMAGQLETQRRQLLDHTEQLEAQVRLRTAELEQANARLRHEMSEKEDMAATDHLTGLSNRRHFAKVLEVCFSDAQRYGYDLACVMLDLDKYKALNDSLGHQMGDRILVAAAKVIQANLRTSDIAARYGGDEFVLLLPHTCVDLAAAVLERIRTQLAMAGSHLKLSRVLTLSVGIASLHANRPPTADALVAMADKALYAAKDAGRNRINLYTSEPAPA